MKKLNNHSGFSVIEAILIVIIVGILGFTGWFVYHSRPVANKNYSSQPVTQTSTAEKPIASSELINVAQQVYIQQSDTADNLPIVGVCGTQTTPVCPFTPELNTKLNTVTNASVAQTLIAGVQNGPFGTLAYSATSSTQGGIVNVILTPSPSAGSTSMTWKLTIVKSGTKLLVNDIMLSKGMNGNVAACGPVEIYDYSSCH